MFGITLIDCNDNVYKLELFFRQTLPYLIPWDIYEIESLQKE